MNEAVLRIERGRGTGSPCSMQPREHHSPHCHPRGLPNGPGRARTCDLPIMSRARGRTGCGENPLEKPTTSEIPVGHWSTIRGDTASKPEQKPVHEGRGYPRPGRRRTPPSRATRPSAQERDCDRAYSFSRRRPEGVHSAGEGEGEREREQSAVLSQGAEYVSTFRRENSGHISGTHPADTPKTRGCASVARRPRKSWGPTNVSRARCCCAGR